MTATIVVTEPELRMLGGSLPDLTRVARVVTAPSQEEESLMQCCADAHTIVCCYAPLTGRIIGASPRLRGIVKYGVGTDSIDIAAATQAGVIVANCPVYGTETIAEHAFALLICLARKVFPMDRAMRRAGWSDPVPGLLGVDLAGKILGIVGCGRIGRALAARASAFRMRCIACDPRADGASLMQEGIRPVSLDELLKTSDAVSIHAVLTPETKGLIGKGELRRMKPSALLVNTARGAIVDEPSLVQALREGWIAGAGLDVFCHEPPGTDHPLLGMDNVILTPHLAWYTREALDRLERDALRNLRDLLDGRVPPFVKNPEAVPLFTRKWSPPREGG